MSHITMSLPALYEYAKNIQQIDIFQNLSVPTSVDRNDLIDRILIKSAPFECVYPNAEYMHAAIGNWSKIHARTFNKWADALAIHYDPLNNYDRTEMFNESGVESNTRTSNRIEDVAGAASDTTLDSNARTESVKNKNNTTTIGSNNDATDTDTTTTDSVSAFDSSSWSDSTKSVVDNTSATTGDSLQATNGTSSDDRTGTDDRIVANTTKDSRKTTNNDDDTADTINAKTHKLRAFGNIGVTTSQALLLEELRIDEWNIYEHIADLFIDEFCVLLY